MKRILVLCTGNSCRSQMAEGWLRYFAGSGAEVYSAGIAMHGVNPRAVLTMRDAGIDISMQTCKLIDPFLEVDFDYIISVCDHARDNCPYIASGADRLHHNFDDPSRFKGTDEQIMKEFERVRDEIKDYCRAFVDTYIKHKNYSFA